MHGDLRAGLGAGRLQRAFAMRILRVASASVLSLVALLLWGAAEPSAARAGRIDPSIAVSSAVAPHGEDVAAEQGLTNRNAAQLTRVGGRHRLLARSRTTDGDGDTPQASALASSSAALFADVGESARARLRRLALGHAPSGEPSPFDATAPPSLSPRNG